MKLRTRDQGGWEYIQLWLIITLAVALILLAVLGVEFLANGRCVG